MVVGAWIAVGVVVAALIRLLKNRRGLSDRVASRTTAYAKELTRGLDESTALYAFAGPTALQPSDRSLQRLVGRLVHKIPQSMWKGETEAVEIRLGQNNAAQLTLGLLGSGTTTVIALPIVETMSVELYCIDAAFQIVSKSRIDQIVRPDSNSLSLALSDATAFVSKADQYGRWKWDVTPLKTGDRPLLLRVSAALRDSNGLPSSASLPPQTFAVAVRVKYASAAYKVASTVTRAMLLAGLGGLAAAYTQTFGGPLLRPY